VSTGSQDSGPATPAAAGDTGTGPAAPAAAADTGPAAPAAAADTGPAAPAAADTGPAAAPAPAAQPGALPPHVIPGVDVASYQGPPGAWQGEAGRYDWAAVKLTELQPSGVRYINPDAAADWAFLGRHGKGRVAYLFGHPAVSAADTVNFFLGELRSLTVADPDGVMLDLEVTDGLSPGQVNSWASDVMARLERALLRPPVLYTYLDFAYSGNTASLGKYPLFIADPSSPPGRPRVPPPWRTWTIHQYDISGAIDRDVANFASLAAMGRTLGYQPKEPTMQDLGGKITGDVAAVRWDSGIIVVAGLGADGFVQIKRWHPKEGIWGPWRNVSLTRAKGAPGLIVFAQNDGLLYYTNDAGAVIELTTKDAGWTWH
jgi:lysozyme